MSAKHDDTIRKTKLRYEVSGVTVKVRPLTDAEKSRPSRLDGAWPASTVAPPKKR